MSNTGRHPGTEHLLEQFEFGHLRGELREISSQCSGMAFAMAGQLQDGPELSAGLRKLLEAKDCFVRQAVADQKAKRLLGQGETSQA